MLSYAFCLLLLGTFANCHKGKANYLETLIDIHDALDILDEQILSMDGSIPLLNDSRRDYAEFVHVIFNIGDSQHGCMIPNYENSYQDQINRFVPQAINHPQDVINEVHNKLKEFSNITQEIRDAIRHDCFPVGYGSQYSNSHRCDSHVQRHVDSKEFPGDQAKVLMAAGKAAKSFLARHNEFLAASEAHEATSYIINGASKLKKVIKDFAGYLKAVFESRLGSPMICLI